MKKLFKVSIAMLLAVSLFGCSSGTASTETETEIEETTEETTEETVAYPTRDDVTVVNVDAPATERAYDVISAEEWSTVLPDIYDSYVENGENNYIVSYLEESPYLVNIYEGYGFAKDYNSAEAHNYCLQDVAETARPHALANCLTCKTADFTALVNATGTDAYSLAFDDVYSEVSENVGCYNCHANNAGNNGELTVTHDYTIAALGDSTLSMDTQVCAQCHTEYYFDPETKATSVPYNSDLTSMTPEEELAYYNEIDFADWTQESTGAKLLKAQHPEVETVAQGVHTQMGLSCADCHMATETAEDGTVYISHKLESPLNNESLLNTCAQCHGDTDMAEKVKAIQDAVTAREDEVGNELSDLKDKLAEANTSGNYSEEELDAIRDLYRSAQWFFDYDYVENSEGAHNSTLANSCLDTAEDYINQALALFK